MDEKVSFTVNEMIGIKGIKWPDAIMDMAAADAGEEADKINLMRATMLLLSAEIGQLITDLLDALGGEEIPTNSDWDDDKWMRGLQSLCNARLTHINGEPVGDQREEGDDFSGSDDELLVKATAYVRESKRASISALQRKFKIGYNRAARLIEVLETLGIVTEVNSNGSREVIAKGNPHIGSTLDSLLHELPAEELDDDEDVI